MTATLRNIFRQLLRLGAVPVSVKAYGAAGDGVTDDTAAIAAAIAAAVNAAVYFPPGTYLTDGQPIAGSIRLSGAGEGLTTIKLNAEEQAPLFYSADASAVLSNVHISDLTIDGNRANQTMVADGNAMGIRVDGWADSSVRRVTIKECATDGLYVTGYGASFVNPAVRCVFEVKVSACRRNGITIICGTDLEFRGGRSTGNGFTSGASAGTLPKSGVDLERNSASQPIQRVRFTDFVSSDNAANGFMVYEGYAHNTALGLQLNNCDASGNAEWGLRAYSAGNAYELHRLHVRGGHWLSNVGGGVALTRVIRGGIGGGMLFVLAGTEKAIQLNTSNNEIGIDDLVIRVGNAATTTIDIAANNTKVFRGPCIINGGRSADAGTGGRHAIPGTVSADRGDASVTLTTNESETVQRFATTLTANRTVTLSATGAYNGAVFRVVRTGLGAFTLDVGGLKTIPSATAAFVDVRHDGTAWRLTGYGTL